MQNPSGISRSILVATVAALVFSGCSANGSQFNPATAIPQNGLASPVAVGSAQSHTATSATRGPAGRIARPPVPICIYNPNDTVWVETSTNPQQWTLYEEGQWCVPLKLWGPCSGSLWFCQTTYRINHIGVYRGNTGPFFHSIVVPFPAPTGPPYQSSSQVLQVTKKAYKVVGDFQMPSSSGALPVAAVVSATTQTTYISVTNPSGGAGVYVYPSGSSSPSVYLTDKVATTGAGVAVDKTGNVYWACDDASGVGHILEFIGGTGQAKQLKIGPNGAAGDIQVDRRDDLVVSEPTQQSIAIYSRKETLINRFALTGQPSSIDLDAKNTNIYVADITNNLVDQYAYPSGTLIASNPPPAINGVTPVLAAVTAPIK